MCSCLRHDQPKVLAKLEEAAANVSSRAVPLMLLKATVLVLLVLQLAGQCVAAHLCLTAAETEPRSTVDPHSACQPQQLPAAVPALPKCQKSSRHIPTLPQANVAQLHSPDPVAGHLGSFLFPQPCCRPMWHKFITLTLLQANSAEHSSSACPASARPLPFGGAAAADTCRHCCARGLCSHLAPRLSAQLQQRSTPAWWVHLTQGSLSAPACWLTPGT